jgi:hypothetical protein
LIAELEIRVDQLKTSETDLKNLKDQMATREGRSE